LWHGLFGDGRLGIVLKRRASPLSPPARRVQLITLATHHRLPTIYSFRENVEIGGLMSYGSSAAGPGSPGRHLYWPHPQAPDCLGEIDIPRLIQGLMRGRSD
jgi:hypothetical protein